MTILAILLDFSLPLPHFPIDRSSDSYKNLPNHNKKTVAFADNPRSIMILLQTEQTRGMWLERVEEKEREGERGRWSIKLSRFYEAGMEMNTPHRTRRVSYAHLSVSRDTIKPVSQPPIHNTPSRTHLSRIAHAYCTHDTRWFGHARGTQKHINLNLTPNSLTFVTLRSPRSDRWWSMDFKKIYIYRMYQNKLLRWL